MVERVTLVEQVVDGKILARKMRKKLLVLNMILLK